MTPRRPRDGNSMNHRVGGHHGDRQTQNSPNENLSDRTIQNKDIVDGNLTTSD
jgi:hypothetical protein